MLEGMGTELGLLNTALIVIGGAAVMMMASKFRLWFKTDWSQMLKQHRRMWREHVKNHIDETGSFD